MRIVRLTPSSNICTLPLSMVWFSSLANDCLAWLTFCEKILTEIFWLVFLLAPLQPKFCEIPTEKYHQTVNVRLVREGREGSNMFMLVTHSWLQYNYHFYRGAAAWWGRVTPPTCWWARRPTPGFREVTTVSVELESLVREGNTTHILVVQETHPRIQRSYHCYSGAGEPGEGG